MCGRFAQKEALEKLAKFYQTLPPAIQFNGNYNVCPTEQVSIIVESPDKEPRRASVFLFSITGSSMKDAGIDDGVQLTFIADGYLYCPTDPTMLEF